MSLITCGIGSIHEGHEWFSDYSRGRQEIFMCLAVLLCEQYFCRFANGSAKISISLTSVYSAALRCWAKLLPFGVNCRLQLAGLVEKKRGNCEANLLYVKSDFVTRHHRQNIYSVHCVLRPLRR